MSNCQVLKLHQTLSEIVIPYISEFYNSLIYSLKFSSGLSCWNTSLHRAAASQFNDLLIWPFTDDNECENVTGICGPNAICTNTVGNYYCTCVSGFTTNGKQEFQTNDGTYCKGMNQSYTTGWVQKVSVHYIDLKNVWMPRRRVYNWLYNNEDELSYSMNCRYWWVYGCW